MTRWLNDDDIEVIRFWTIIATGSMIGLLGAYGRERHEGREPDRKWLVLRFCIMPLLALGAAALSDIMGLSTQVAAFVAALFSLLAYDLVRVIAIRALKKAAGDISTAIRDTEGVAEVPAGHAPAASAKLVILRSPDPRAAGVERLAEGPMPTSSADLNALLDKLD